MRSCHEHEFITYVSQDDDFYNYPINEQDVKRMPDFTKISEERKKAKGLEPMPTPKLLKMMREKMDLLSIKEGYLSRNMNEGFSGGEKKRNEIFQMAVLNPKLAILDETDSGLDIDALKTVAEGVNALRGSDRAIIIITHYQRLLDYIIPDRVHVLSEGRIVKSGDKDLALELESKGYSWVDSQVTLDSETGGH